MPPQESVLVEDPHGLMYAGGRRMSGRRMGQQFGRTRHRARHGSTGRAGQSKAAWRLTGCFGIAIFLGSLRFDPHHDPRHQRARHSLVI
jgi:hypothetical protein